MKPLKKELRYIIERKSSLEPFPEWAPITERTTFKSIAAVLRVLRDNVKEDGRKIRYRVLKVETFTREISP